MGWVGWWGLQSHFRVQPNICVEVVLRCVVVGVLTGEIVVILVCKGGYAVVIVYFQLKYSSL